jgi:lipopolysaccharide/colanic/teichoic acid biosynthesis glycosyltransferase
MSEEERKKLDVDYSKHFTGDNYSFWYDFGLILRTFKALFQKDTV